MSDYPADLYAATHTGTPGDLAFYRQWCDGARHLLELGCGSGRVLDGLRDLEAELVGLDAWPELLALARERLRDRPRTSLREGDMRSFDLGRTFDRILIPHSGIYCLLDDASLQACLACVRRHLAPAGLLIFDAYSADDFHSQAEPSDFEDDAEVDLGVVTVADRSFRVGERSTWDPSRQRIVATYRYQPEDGSAPRHGVIEQRYLLLPQVRAHLEAAGLELAWLGMDFEARPADPNDESWAAVARLRG